MTTENKPEPKWSIEGQWIEPKSHYYGRSYHISILPELSINYLPSRSEMLMASNLPRKRHGKMIAVWFRWITVRLSIRYRQAPYWEPTVRTFY